MAESKASSGNLKAEVANEDGLVLYHTPMSFFSRKVVFALHEKQLKFQSRHVNLGEGEQYEPWFLKLNPEAEVPVLKDGVKIIPDSSRIIDYLEDNFSNGDTPRLKPEKGTPQFNTMERFQAKFDKLSMPLVTFGCIFHPELTSHAKMGSRERRVRRELIPHVLEVLEKCAEKKDEFKSIYNAKLKIKSKMFDSIQNVLCVQKAISDLGTVLEEVNTELATHDGDKASWFLCGETFTPADITLAIILRRTVDIGLWNEYFGNGKLPKLNDYYKRVQHRDAFRKTMHQSNCFFDRICCLGPSEKLAITVIVFLSAIGVAYLIKRKK